ncbi:Protein O-mannosyltransferase 2 [Massospora cicadina]|nr:Protein O-mannosyltransferase 2 [Massospora cicadina]
MDGQFQRRRFVTGSTGTTNFGVSSSTSFALRATEMVGPIVEANYEDQVGTSKRGRYGVNLGYPKPGCKRGDAGTPNRGVVTAFGFTAYKVWVGVRARLESSVEGHRVGLNLLFLTGLAAFTRYYRIGWANKPIWDEVHFGKFGSYYLRGTFYHDVHPPLGKMLVALGGKLAGYDGTFKFEGDAYNDTINYVAMRIFHATFGVALVPIAYLTALELDAGSGVPFGGRPDPPGRFILLDAMLLCFIALSVYFLAAFHAARDRPFTGPWWGALAFLGVPGVGFERQVDGAFHGGAGGAVYFGRSLGQVGRVGDAKGERPRWVAWLTGEVGVRLPLGRSLRLLSAVAARGVHPLLSCPFAILNNSGPGDGVMDSLFQARLNRNQLGRSPPEMVYFANVTLRSGALDGGLLHSHPHNYPLGSGEQQITGYGFKDANNDFTLLQVGTDPPETPPPDPPKVRNRDLVRLRHVETGRFLRVQPGYDAIVSKARAYEVSGSGATTASHPHEVWRVEIVDDLLLSATPSAVQTLSTRFRLRNPATGCLLASADPQYPSWGYHQREVYCLKDPAAAADETLWNVEELRYEGMAPGPRRPIPAKFVRNFIRIHKAMWSTNNALVPDEDRLDHLTSRAWEWPLMRRGIRMCGWGDADVKYYMLGNPLVWWLSSLGVGLYGLLLPYDHLRRRRHAVGPLHRDGDTLRDTSGGREAFRFTGKVLVGGWALQFGPFFLMGRVLYVHHYFPALYFACLFAPLMVERVLRAFEVSRGVVIWVAIAASYTYFAPMTFGMDFPSAQFASRAWLGSWHLSGPEDP